MSWQPSQIENETWGRLQIVVDDVDVTFFRDVPSKVRSWSSGDPFGDATAVLEFSQISSFEAYGEGELDWLRGHAMVEINLVRPDNSVVPLWEGMIASLEDETSSDSTGVIAECIGALYQLDYYIRAPNARSQPALYENFIRLQFNKASRPALRTAELEIEYPAGLENTGLYTRYSGSWEESLTGYVQRLLADMYHPIVTSGASSSGINEVQEIVLEVESPPFSWGGGYPSPDGQYDGEWTITHVGLTTDPIPWDFTASDVRNALIGLESIDDVAVTGSGTTADPLRIEFTGGAVRWRHQPLLEIDHTGIVHDHSATYVHRVQGGELPKDGDGIKYVQWTLLKDPGRVPVLKVRDEETIHWNVSTGAPGVTHDLKSDYSQSPNVYYGEGTDESGTSWRNSRVRVYGDGSSRVQHWPLAWSEEVHPADKDFSEIGETTDPPPPEFNDNNVRIETVQKYGAGVALEDARASAEKQRVTGQDPGHFGTLKLESDPEEGSRFEIKAGDNIFLRWYRGEGVLLHVSEVDIDIDGLTVTLTVDSKFRDLATLANLIERTKSANKNPAKMLTVNRESANTDDTKFPWDYQAGSGSIPTGGHLPLVGTLPLSTPAASPDLFVHVNGSNDDPYLRWTVVPVVASSRGSISKAEVRVYNHAGQPLAIPFHVGVYGAYITEYSMPLEPFAPGAFDQSSDDPLVGFDSSAVILWGQSGQRAGYWPGLESEGDSPTGVMIDDGTWQYELPDGEAVLWVAIYAESDCYVQGRFFHGVQD